MKTKRKPCAVKVGDRVITAPDFTKTFVVREVTDNNRKGLLPESKFWAWQANPSGWGVLIEDINEPGSGRLLDSAQVVKI